MLRNKKKVNVDGERVLSNGSAEEARPVPVKRALLEEWRNGGVGCQATLWNPKHPGVWCVGQIPTVTAVQPDQYDPLMAGFITRDTNVITREVTERKVTQGTREAVNDLLTGVALPPQPWSICCYRSLPVSILLQDETRNVQEVVPHLSLLSNLG